MEGEGGGAGRGGAGGGGAEGEGGKGSLYTTVQCHIIKADEIKNEKHTYPKAADLHHIFLKKNRFASSFADTATGQCTVYSRKKRT